jgi:hypothetical protein
MELRDDEDIVYKALAPPTGNKHVLKYASGRLKADFEFMAKCAEADGLAFTYGSEEVRANKMVAMAAVSQNGHALYYASSALKSNREVVRAAVLQDGYALLSANEKLKHDRELVMEAVQGDGLVYMTCGAELHNDREVAMLAVKQNGMALEFCSRNVRKQRPIIIEAVKQNGLALRFANDMFRADRLVVRYALEQVQGENFGGTDHLATPEEWKVWAKKWVKHLCEAEWPPKSKSREEVLAEVEAQRLARVGMAPVLQNKLSKSALKGMTKSRRASIILIQKPTIDPSSSSLPEARKLRLGSMFGQTSLTGLGSRGASPALTLSNTNAGILRIQQAMLGVVDPPEPVQPGAVGGSAGGSKLLGLVAKAKPSGGSPWLAAVKGHSSKKSAAAERQGEGGDKARGKFKLASLTKRMW